MNLIIDIGNTAVKYGVFKGQEMLMHGSVFSDQINNLISDVEPFTIEKVIVSAVADIPGELTALLNKQPVVINLDDRTFLPLTNAYETPQTLGKDRLSNACGAVVLFPEQNVLVVDAGTCLKFDFIDAEGVYHGGAISPGLRMRFNALHQDTARLPLLEPVQHPTLIGHNTFGSIQSGVVNGMIAEINEIIRQYEEQFSRLELIITGGDSPFFLNQLKSRIFAAPTLTLLGLNAILECQPPS